MKLLIVIPILAILMSAGAIGLYLYTLAPAVTTSTTSSGATSVVNSSSRGTAPLSGWQDSAGQPQGTWAAYLGYIPDGYVIAPHYQNAGVYSCPSNMNSAQCKLFQASCGNGVCDPNESCASCPIDCGVPGNMGCDPYTGRPGATVAVCQIQR
jgi:hypothetical protein